MLAYSAFLFSPHDYHSLVTPGIGLSLVQHPFQLQHLDITGFGLTWMWTSITFTSNNVGFYWTKKSEYNPVVSQCFEYSLTATSNDTLSILFILCICQCVPLSQFASCNVFYCNASFYGFLQCFFCGSFPISSVFAISWCLLFPLLHWQ